MADNFDDDAVDMAPKPGRRRATDVDDDGEEEQQAAGEQPAQQARPPKKGGWGDSSSTPAAVSSNVSSAVVVESGSISTNLSDDGSTPQGDQGKPTGFGRRATVATTAGNAAGRPKDKYDDVITDITEIPDLDEGPREQDLASVVADAPNVRTNRVQALQELDQQILFQLPSAMGDGIDLSLLTSVLSSQENVSDPDALWEFDQLFADVSSEMQAELEPPEKEEGEEGEGEEGEDNGVAKGDGKKAAAAPIRDRSNKVETEQK